MNIKVEPIALNWQEAKSYATRHAGRLLFPSELLMWSKNQKINVDVWTAQEDFLTPSHALYLHRTKGIPLSKDKNKKCLLVYVMANQHPDPKDFKR